MLKMEYNYIQLLQLYSAEAMAHHQGEILKALAVGVAAWFRKLPKRSHKLPKAAKHVGELVCHEMVRHATKWRCVACAATGN